MARNSHAELTHMHHTARWFSTLERWAVINQDQELIATIVMTATRHKNPRNPKRWYTMTELNITLILGGHRLSPSRFIRPGSERTALRWAMAQLNNGNFWLGARLLLEREARLLDYSESELLACEHAYDYEYCLQLLANLPGLLES